jgi:ATP-binding cassette subfamily B protein
VDVETEATIMEAMRRLMSGRTTFMIAHRLGTLDHCDMRLSLRGGRVRQVPGPDAERRLAAATAILDSVAG